MRPLSWLSAAVAVFGAALSLVAASPAHAVLVVAFAPLAWPDAAPAELGAWGRLGFVISGAVTSGWGVSLHQVAQGRPMQAFTAGLLVWFALDSFGSVTTGFPGNVVFNLGFLVPFLLVARSRR
jgi:hypothetical protein